MILKRTALFAKETEFQMEQTWQFYVRYSPFYYKIRQRVNGQLSILFSNNINGNFYPLRVDLGCHQTVEEIGQLLGGN